MILAEKAKVRRAKSTHIQCAKALLRRVEGRHNPLLKELRKAFARSEPGQDGACAIEGWHIIDEAIRSGLKLQAVFISDSSEARAQKLLPQLGAHVEKLLLPDSLFASAVPSETPQGVAALVHCRTFKLEDVLARSETGPILAIAGVQDPGNLGTILRSAEAFDAAGVLLGDGTVSPLNWKAVRASAGSVFRLPVVKVELRNALSELRTRGFRLVATSSHKGTQLDKAPLNGSVAIFIGSEGSGLPRELRKEMNDIVEIPHSANVESLNAGVAASIVLYEVARQRNCVITAAQRHVEESDS
jgi:RNA methyltransferase, TrmH family